MSITSIAQTNSTTATTQASKGFAAMDGEDFMQILIKQLQYQDPMQPMSNEAMVSQIASIRELELNARLSQKLEGLTDQQRFGAASALIGKHVKGQVQDANGNTFDYEGVVTGIQFSEKGEAMLELDTGETMPLSALVEVTDPALSASTTKLNETVSGNGTSTSNSSQTQTA